MAEQEARAPKPATRAQADKAMDYLRRYVPAGEWQAMRQAMRGEERQHFYDKVVELAALIATMPGLYAQEKAGIKAIAYLHYFTADADWWITEVSAEGEAFGLADLYGDGGECGYMSLPELVAAGAKLDLHWKPKALAECRKPEPAKSAAPVVDLEAEGEALRLEGEQQGAIDDEDGDWPF